MTSKQVAAQTTSIKDDIHYAVALLTSCENEWHKVRVGDRVYTALTLLRKVLTSTPIKAAAVKTESAEVERLRALVHSLRRELHASMAREIELMRRLLEARGVTSDT